MGPVGTTDFHSRRAGTGSGEDGLRTIRGLAPARRSITLVSRTAHADRRSSTGSTRPAARPSEPGDDDARRGIVALQHKIAARIGHGGTLADVRREIIGPCGLSEDQRTALWFYAASQPAILRAAKPLSHVRLSGVR